MSTMAVRAQETIPIWQFWLGVAILFGSGAITVGSVMQRLSYVERQAAATEVENQRLYELMYEVSERTARIEAKLENGR